MQRAQQAGRAAGRGWWTVPVVALGVVGIVGVVGVFGMTGCDKREPAPAPTTTRPDPARMAESLDKYAAEDESPAKPETDAQPKGSPAAAPPGGQPAASPTDKATPPPAPTPAPAPAPGKPPTG